MLEKETPAPDQPSTRMTLALTLPDASQEQVQRGGSAVGLPVGHLVYAKGDADAASAWCGGVAGVRFVP